MPVTFTAKLRVFSPNGVRVKNCENSCSLYDEKGDNCIAWRRKRPLTSFSSDDTKNSVDQKKQKSKTVLRLRVKPRAWLLKNTVEAANLGILWVRFRDMPNHVVTWVVTERFYSADLWQYVEERRHRGYPKSGMDKKMSSISIPLSPLKLISGYTRSPLSESEILQF